LQFELKKMNDGELVRRRAKEEEDELVRRRAKEEEDENLERLQNMFDKEVGQFSLTFNPYVWYTPIRRKLVDWICEKVDKDPFYLHRMTFHVAVFYLDRIFTSFLVKNEQTQMIAASCMFVAAKMEEKDWEFCPSIRQIIIMCDGIYSRQTLFQTEIEILRFFKWNMNVVTTIHFVGYFSPLILDGAKDAIDGKVIHPTQFKTIKGHLLRFAEFFSDLSLQYYEFCEYRFSAVAAACVYCSRKQLGISPLWTLSLEMYTTYKEDEIAVIVDLLFDVYRKEFNEEDRKTHCNNNNNKK